MSRILIVEDDPGIAMAIEDDLRAEGHVVEVVADGVTATARGLDGAFDAILLDVMLPKKDGFAVCRDVRAGGVRTPIILLTARTAEPDKILGLETGADDYVTKPYSPGELLARIKAVLRRASEALPEVFRFGTVEVDFSRREVRREDARLAALDHRARRVGGLSERPATAARCSLVGLHGDGRRRHALPSGRLPPAQEPATGARPDRARPHRSTRNAPCALPLPPPRAGQVRLFDPL